MLEYFEKVKEGTIIEIMCYDGSEELMQYKFMGTSKFIRINEIVGYDYIKQTESVDVISEGTEVEAFSFEYIGNAREVARPIIVENLIELLQYDIYIPTLLISSPGKHYDYLNYGNVVLLPIKNIKQCRNDILDIKMKALAENLQRPRPPIKVRKIPKKEKYMLLDGNHRLAFSKLHSYEFIPCIIDEPINNK